MWISGEARGKTKSFFLGCERALLADKKSTLCVITSSLGSDKLGPMQREERGQKQRGIWAASFEGSSELLKRLIRS